MNYEIEKKLYHVKIVRKNNRNTYIRINDNGEIYVTTNYLTPNRKIIKLLDQNKSKIIKMLQNKERQLQRSEQFYYLGKPYDIIFEPVKQIIIQNSFIIVENEQKLHRWLKKQMKQLFQERLNYCYQKFNENIPYPNLKIRTMKTRWGVCNRQNNTVTLNSKLMEYEIEQLDYVIIHELSHFVHFDHSKQFWNTVEKYDPNYKQNRKKLKE